MRHLPSVLSPPVPKMASSALDNSSSHSHCYRLVDEKDSLSFMGRRVFFSTSTTLANFPEVSSVRIGTMPCPSCKGSWKNEYVAGKLDLLVMKKSLRMTINHPTNRIFSFISMFQGFYMAGIGQALNTSVG